LTFFKKRPIYSATVCFLLRGIIKAKLVMKISLTTTKAQKLLFLSFSWFYSELQMYFVTI